MKIRISVVIFVIAFYYNSHSQPTDCNKIPFYPADHIRNPSLEQILTSCEDVLGAEENGGGYVDMKLVVPFWRYPIKKNGHVDYLGACNNFVHPVTPGMNDGPPKVPQPIPDGKGVIGLTALRTVSGTRIDDSLTLKNYVSNNLYRILKKDSLYRLNFAIGFGSSENIIQPSYFSGSPVKFTLYGLRDSSKIPFTPPTIPGLLGCLTTHFPEWISLGSVTITGDANTWQRATIDFIAPVNIESIAIGPGCIDGDVPYDARNIDRLIDYYFIDDLKFFQASAPKPTLSKIAGSSCESESITLRLQSNNFYNGSAFQWFRNNSPIPETNVSITTSRLNYGEGWYKMRVQNDSVCMISDSVYLEWAPRIIDPYLGKPDTILCMGDTIQLKVSAGTIATYLWSTGSTDSSIFVNKTGTYTVRVSNACNTLNVFKTVLYKDCPPTVFVPTAFTPNGDGLNDIFRVSASGTIKSFSLFVYDHFGQIIFFSDDPSKGWDGTIKSKKQNTRLYIWMLKYTDGSNKTVSQKGTLTLIK